MSWELIKALGPQGSGLRPPLAVLEISCPGGKTPDGPDLRTQGVRPERNLLGIQSSWGPERGNLTLRAQTPGSCEHLLGARTPVRERLLLSILPPGHWTVTLGLGKPATSRGFLPPNTAQKLLQFPFTLPLTSWDSTRGPEEGRVSIAQYC